MVKREEHAEMTKKRGKMSINRNKWKNTTMNTLQINKLEKLVTDYRLAEQGQVDLKKITCYAITYYSTAIEGSTLTEGQVYNLLNQDMPAKNKPRKSRYSTTLCFNNTKSFWKRK
jgi:hypothetical protein